MKVLYRRYVSSLLLVGLTALLTLQSAEARTARLTDDEKAATAAKKSTILRGRASWYGREFQGRRTSNGERFDRNQYTCAHKTLPFGTRLRVSNPKTGEAVVVRVSDRGPFRHQRILDLAEVAARPLGIITHGAVSVVAEVVPDTTPLGPTEAPDDLQALAADPIETATLHTDIAAGHAEAADVALTAEPTATYVVQAGTFGDVRNARAVMDKIQGLEPALSVTTLTGASAQGKPLNRVVVGRFATAAEANAVRLRLARAGVAGLVRQTENL
ncbi:septal ring lytic transglycosylase RlpA family protein [Hymenobacter psychrophilus]|uniref:Probable endolytic peptidoglycan transglycosylase RlpA n=1 Tax=Hymenobacter psychrophilus TaxID=651662 RepID=A0A1H3JKK8_9BACT|nr:septal ring lytic transglycosylase RlpA family protein [Hymenobacter psychrophilus]SDY39754.1 rare lipoprotein A [Hymenobacter psychrophilus]